MDSNPTFSIVIPSYNYGHFLVNALESVIAQNRADVEVLLIDDASIDNTPEIAQRYSDRIIYVRNEHNLGAGGAWGVGIALAKGKYLIKLDADDELLPGHLDALETAFISDPQVGMVIASVFTKTGEETASNPEYVVSENTLYSSEKFREKLLECLPFRMPGCALRREVTLNHEAPDPKLFQIHDWEFFLRVTNGYKAVLLKNPTAVYRLHSQSISAVARQDDRLYNDIQRWLRLLTIPGERFIDEHDRRTLKGSLACLLLFGFGSKTDPMSYVRFVPVYFRTLAIAMSGGLRQVARMHQALLQRVSSSSNSNFE